MNNPKFQLFRSSVNAEYYFRLRAANGEIVLNSEGYKAKKSCLDGIISVRNNSPFDSRYSRRDGVNKHSFSLKAPNGEVIGRSESYTSSAARENGISVVKNIGSIAPVEELS